MIYYCSERRTMEILAFLILAVLAVFFGGALGALFVALAPFIIGVLLIALVIGLFALGFQYWPITTSIVTSVILAFGIRESFKHTNDH